MTLGKIARKILGIEDNLNEIREEVKSEFEDWIDRLDHIEELEELKNYIEIEYNREAHSIEYIIKEDDIRHELDLSKKISPSMAKNFVDSLLRQFNKNIEDRIQTKEKEDIKKHNIQ